MNRVLVNVSASGWAVHFIAPDGRTRMGPWLLHDTGAEVDVLLTWGNIAPDEMEEHRRNIRRWGAFSVVWQLTDRQLAQLIERGEGWPWNGYELKQMKEAGKYPPRRLAYRSSLTGTIVSGTTPNVKNVRLYFESVADRSYADLKDPALLWVATPAAE